MDPRESRRALGRGLAALLPPTAEAKSAAGGTAEGASGLRTLPIERIRPNPKQPRKHFDEEALRELASSIETQGVVQPIVVRRLDGDVYEIVAGERRWRAAALAGLHELPALVRELSDQDTLQIALIENIQRRDLDPLEEASAYHRLVHEHGLAQADVAVAVGKSRVAVANSLRLLKLPEEVLEMLSSGQLSAGHARALMTLDDNRAMQVLARQAVQRGLSVRDTEVEARRAKRTRAPAAAERAASEVSVEEKLQRALGTKVRLHHRKGKGRIEVFFHSLDQLEGLLDKLTR